MCDLHSEMWPEHTRTHTHTWTGAWRERVKHMLLFKLQLLWELPAKAGFIQKLVLEQGLSWPEVLLSLSIPLCNYRINKTSL